MATDFSPGKGERNRNTVVELGVRLWVQQEASRVGAVSGDMSPD